MDITSEEVYLLKKGRRRFPPGRFFAKHPKTGELFLLFGQGVYSLFCGDRNNLNICTSEAKHRTDIDKHVVLEFSLNGKRMLLYTSPKHPGSLFYSDDLNREPIALIATKFSFIT